MGNKSSRPTEEEENNTISLLLLGRTGTGKSSTGNNILQLGKEVFKTDDTDSSITTECKAEYSRYQGQDIKVVDMPGLSDASKDRDEDLKTVVAAAMDAVGETPDGYDALLIVTQYGRQSMDNKTTVEQIKDMFGQNVIKQYGILVITRGDDFKRKLRKDGTLTVEQYCSQQTGQINELWKECNKRVVVFNNVTENESEMEAQRMELFGIVEKMRSTKRYTPELFEAAKAKRDEMLQKAEQFVLTEAMRKKLRLIIHDLNNTDINNSNESDKQLVEIRERAAVLMTKISIQGKKVKAGEKMEKVANSLKSAVKEKLDLVRIVFEYQEKTKVRERILNETRSESEKENYKKMWTQDNKSDEETIRKMKKKVADNESRVEKDYQSLLKENSYKKEIITFVVLSVIMTVAPAAAGVAGLGAAAFAAGFGGRVLVGVAARGLVAAAPGFVKLAYDIKKKFW